MAIVGDGNNSSFLTQTVTLTTSVANDIIILFIMANVTSGTAASSVSDVAGLTWAKRASASVTSGRICDEWWAASPGILTGDTITVTFPSAQSFIVLSVLSFAGTNFNAPFDTNVSLPAVATANGAEVTFSTSNAETMAVAGMRFQSTSAPTAGPGWTGVLSGASGRFAMTEQRSFSSAQTNTLAGATTGINDENGAIADALVPSPVSRSRVMDFGGIAFPSPGLVAALAGARAIVRNKTTTRRRLLWPQR